MVLNVCVHIFGLSWDMWVAGILLIFTIIIITIIIEMLISSLFYFKFARLHTQISDSMRIAPHRQINQKPHSKQKSATIANSLPYLFNC